MLTLFEVWATELCCSPAQAADRKMRERGRATSEPVPLDVAFEAVAMAGAATRAAEAAPLGLAEFELAMAMIADAATRGTLAQGLLPALPRTASVRSARAAAQQPGSSDFFLAPPIDSIFGVPALV